MAISALFKKLADAGLYLVQTGEQLISGDTGDDGTDGAGANRRFGQLFKNDEALFTALQGLNTALYTGGGTISWSGTALTLTSNLTLWFVSEIGGVTSNVIPSGTYAIADGGYLVAVLDRETDGASAVVVTPTTPANLLSVLGSGASRLDSIVLGYRSGSNFYFLNRMEFESGDTGTLYNAPAYADNEYEGYLREIASRVIYGNGTVFSWDLSLQLLVWSGDILIRSPITSGVHTLSSGSVSLSAGQAIYVTFSFDNSGSVALSATAAAIGSVPDVPGTVILAVRPTGSDVVYLWDGTYLDDGDQGVIGQGARAVATLRGDNGGVVLEGGQVDILGGTGISTSGVSLGAAGFGGTITVTNDIVDLSDLNSGAVTADLEAGILGALELDPNSGNPLVTSGVLRNVYGFSHIYTTDGITIKVSPGTYVDSADGTAYTSTSVTDVVITGTPFTLGEWQYLYVKPPSSGTAPDFEWSPTAPTGGLYGNSFAHPANLNWRCIASGYAAAANRLTVFEKNGKEVLLPGEDLSDVAPTLDTTITGLIAASQTTSSINLPVTARGHVDLSFLIYVKTAGSGGSFDALGYPARYVVGVGPSYGSSRYGIVNDDGLGTRAVSVIDRWPVLYNGSAHSISGLFDTADYQGTVGFEKLNGYGEAF